MMASQHSCINLGGSFHSKNIYVKVALFVPCYIDQFYPDVAKASLLLLQKLGVSVDVPMGQTCCGQPMANSGYDHLGKSCNHHYIDLFDGYDYVVSPSASCVLHIKEHLKDEKRMAKADHLRKHSYELTEFLTDILKVDRLNARFPHRVGIHQGCHGLRGLHLGSMSETMNPVFSKPEQLLRMVKDITISYPERIDECCGFGGTFCVFEEAVSVRMGESRITEHQANDVEFITSNDMSCLMHLEGILSRQKSSVKVKHIAEILNHA